MKLDGKNSGSISGLVAGYFGLSSNYLSEYSIELHSGSRVSIKDFADLPLEKGNNFLTEAIRIDQMTIHRKTGTGISILDGTIQKMKLAGAEVRYVDDGTAEISGANLYVAYKLVNVSKPIRTHKKIDIQFDERNSVSVGDFRLTTWSQFRYNCAAGPKAFWQVDNDSIRIMGSPLMKSDSQALSRRPHDQYPGAFEVTSNLAIPVYRGMVDNAVVEAQVRIVYSGAEFPRGGGICSLVTEGAGKSTAELSVLEYRFKSAK